VLASLFEFAIPVGENLRFASFQLVQRRKVTDRAVKPNRIPGRAGRRFKRVCELSELGARFGLPGHDRSPKVTKGLSILRQQWAYPSALLASNPSESHVHAEEETATGTA